ncbi:MAG: AMP-binding protein, partial [Cytophagales bacterium]|nr:AMP-binding protein [Cytophagales bacterium]
MNVVRNDVSPLAALLDAAFGAYADRAALSDGPTRYSYRDLDRMTARLCAILDQKEVPANAPVILLMDRGIQVIVWALAVFRRGGIVCPLDVTLPAETIRAIICKLPDPLVVADYPGGRLRENLASLAAGGTGLLDGSAVEGGTAGGAASFRRHAAGPGDAAYLLCTSGSTGTPKLVQGGQKGLVNYILWQLEAVGAQPGDRFSHLAPVSFDFSFKEWLVPLAGGAEVVVGADALRFDVTSLARWISRNTITVLCCIPFVFRQIVNALQEDSPHAPWLKSCYALPRLLMISGETLHAHPVVAWQRAMGATPALMNLYGPTESTVIKLFNQIPYPYADASESVPLGKAIRGTRVEITDERGEVVPKGVTGQICLVSADLALGYWDEPRLTAEKFVRTGREATPAHATLLTGDYGYLDENENVVYGGRMDFQV